MGWGETRGLCLERLLERFARNKKKEEKARRAIDSASGGEERGGKIGDLPVIFTCSMIRLQPSFVSAQSNPPRAGNCMPYSIVVVRAMFYSRGQLPDESRIGRDTPVASG